MFNRYGHPMAMLSRALVGLSLLFVTGGHSVWAAPLPYASLVTVPGEPQPVEQITWWHLLPPAIRVPEPVPGVDVAAGQLAPEDNHDFFAPAQSSDFRTNPELAGRRVRLPGFVVPLDLDTNGKVVQLLIVPYYGACLHLPAPHPYQIIAVDYPQGLQLKSLFTAYWVTGTVATRVTRSPTAAAAYVMLDPRIEEYRRPRP